MSGANAILALCEAVGVAAPRGWDAYFDVVQSWNERTDLTSARTAVELAEILFLDAANAILGGWVQASASVLDVGAGVGAPTIPLLLSDESLRGTLVEPRRIRTAFLRTALGASHLGSRARVFEQRVDAVDPRVEGAPFSVALSRATFAPEEWIKIGAQLADEVWVLTAGTEVEDVGALRLVRRLDYEVPSSGAPRSMLAYQH